MAKMICTCNNVDEEILASKIKQGFDTLDKIMDETTASTVCGSCKRQIIKMIEELKN